MTKIMQILSLQGNDVPKLLVTAPLFLALGMGEVMGVSDRRDSRPESLPGPGALSHVRAQFGWRRSAPRCFAGRGRR